MSFQVDARERCPCDRQSPVKSPRDFSIKPRFGWSGVGQILQETGWHAAPDVLEMPVVPGSASEVPPWVLAGPVLSRLADLLRDLKRGYEFVDDTRAQPKGTIRWAEYASRHVPRGDLHHIPCRYPDLGIDPEIVRAVRWTLERLHSELARVGGRDRIATTLVQLALHVDGKSEARTVGAPTARNIAPDPDNESVPGGCNSPRTSGHRVDRRGTRLGWNRHVRWSGMVTAAGGAVGALRGVALPF